jgi:hypothetical protein
MKKLFFFLSLAALSLMTFSGCQDEELGPTEGPKYQDLNTAMRVLWSDHALWTRNVIINIIDGTPGTTEAVARLLKNQEDIGNAIKPYYGDAGGEALTTLLKEHITIAADLLTAAKTGNTDAFNTAHDAWYANGEEIAVFLNTANPEFFPLADWKSMMKSHLDLTLEEAVARLQADYAADVAAYDKVYAELMMMADMLSEGIANQFPDQF